jgi:hypothetical protein
MGNSMDSNIYLLVHSSLIHIVGDLLCYEFWNLVPLKTRIITRKFTDFLFHCLTKAFDCIVTND